MKKKFRLTDNSSNRCVDTLWNGRDDFTLHDTEDWKGGLIVTIYMEGVHFFSEIFLGKKRYCDVIVESVATGKLYYTKKEYLSEDLEKRYHNSLFWERF